MEEFSAVFTSIVLEALPFIIIGVLLSSIIQMYISEEHIERILPKNKLLGGILAALTGIFFPTCECTSVPITTGLIKKGVPVNMAVTYMMAAPIVNPLVVFSTYYAFNGNIKVVVLRLFIGIISAIIIGYIVYIFNPEDISKVMKSNADVSNYCSCGCCTNNQKGIRALFYHASLEFRSVFVYFIIGAFLASISNLIISRQNIMNIKLSPVLCTIIMMVFAYLVSLCSEADAFVASTFASSFPLCSIMSFLVLGPMIDIKNTLMLMCYFKKSFVFKLTFFTFAVNFILCSIII